MNYRSVHAMIIFLSILYPLHGMKLDKKTAGHISRTLIEANDFIVRGNTVLPLLKNGGNDYGKDKDSQLRKNKKIALKKGSCVPLTTVSFGENLIIPSKKEVINQIFTAGQLRNGNTVIKISAKKGGDESIQITHGVWRGGCSSHCLLLSSSLSFIQKYGSDRSSMNFEIITPGILSQCGADYRLAPKSSLGGCSHYILGLPDQRYNINEESSNERFFEYEQFMKEGNQGNVDRFWRYNPLLFDPISFKDIAEKVKTVSFTITLYDSEALKKKEKALYPFDWGVMINDRGEQVALQNKTLQEYPVELFTKDYYRWLCNPMVQEREKSIATKDAQYHFDQVKFAQETLELAYKDKASTVIDAESLEKLEQAREATNKRIRALLWWLSHKV